MKHDCWVRLFSHSSHSLPLPDWPIFSIMNVHLLTNEPTEKRDLRVFLSIFDRTLTAHFLKTDDARANRFLLLKQLTPTVHDDTISDVTAPSSGSSELIKFKFQTLSTFATVIRF